jgi:hypothetical protein
LAKWQIAVSAVMGVSLLVRFWPALTPATMRRPSNYAIPQIPAEPLTFVPFVISSEAAHPAHILLARSNSLIYFLLHRRTHFLLKNL